MSNNSTIPMWSKGQSDSKEDQLCRPVLARVSEMPEKYTVEEHQHPWGQLAYASRGIMKVNTPSASYIIPPEKALWIPPRTPHIIFTRFGLSFRSLYIDNNWSKNLPSKTSSIDVDNLLRELILVVTTWDDDYVLDDTNINLLKVLIDQIKNAKREPLSLNMPVDKRLIRITSQLNKDPANKTTLEQWSKEIGATSRTLNRLFLKETHMGFVEWRQRLRILYSLEQIERGDPINTIALGLGYESGSAFITMFKKHLGQSPRRYFQDADNKIMERFDQSIESSS